MNISTFASLSSSSFRTFFVGSAFTTFALQMQLMVRSWYMYELTDSSLMIGYLGIATGFTMMPFSLLGGALADRMHKGKLLQIGAVGAGFSTLLVAAIVFAGLMQWWILIATTMLFSMSIGITMPTRLAIVPELVDKKSTLNAISLSAAFMNLTTILAPAVGGRLIAVVGVGGAYSLMSVLNFAGALILQLLPRTLTKEDDKTNRSIKQDLKDGASYLKTQPVLIHLILFAIAVVLFGLPFQFMLPVFSKDVLGLGSQQLGDMLAVMGVGALIGSLSIASLKNFDKKGLLLILLTVLFGASIVAFSFSRNLAISLLILLPIGVGQTARMTLNTTMIQEQADPKMIGRIMSIFMLTLGLHSVGILPISAISEQLGISIALAIAGFVVMIYAIGVGVLKPSIRQIP